MALKGPDKDFSVGAAEPMSEAELVAALTNQINKLVAENQRLRGFVDAVEKAIAPRDDHLDMTGEHAYDMANAIADALARLDRPVTALENGG